MKIGRMNVSRAFLVFLALMFYLDGSGLFVWTVFAAAVHEFAHLGVLKLAGGQMEGVRLSLFGANITIAARPPLGYRQELLATAAGPVANILLAFVMALAGRLFCWETGYAVAGISMVFGIFNLLPAMPLDGGHILSLLLLQMLPVRHAELICLAAGALTAAVLIGAGLHVLLATGQNITLLLAGVYAAFAVIKANGTLGGRTRIML